MKVAELFEGLKYEDPKGFGRKLFNKVMGIPSGPYKYKVGDTVKYEMSPAQEGGSGTGKITKLLDGHHYLVNGKPVNQNEIKAKLEEGWKTGAAAVALSAAVVAGIANSPKVEINGETYDKASSLRSAPADAKTATVSINGKKTKVLYWTAMGTKHNRKNRVYAAAE